MSKLPRPIRCAIYTRKSTADGLEKDFNSLNAQREACEAYILSHALEGWELIPETFSDGGFTGANTDRPGFQKLMAWIAKHRIDLVVVYKVDRLSRSLVDFAQVMETFSQRSVAFVSVTQNFSTTDPVGRLTLNMLMSFAEFEREMITERIRDKVRAARRKGCWTGGNAPLGYYSHEARLLVHPEEAPWAIQVFAWYLEGVSALEISHRLNAAQVPLKTSSRQRPNPWTKALVLRILRNRLYVAEIRCQGEYVPAQHPRLIDQETFDQVQVRLAPKNRRERQTVRNPAYLVRGSLVCALCGVRMTSASTFRDGRLHRYYRCRTRDKQGKGICPTVQLPAEALETFVVERIQAALLDEELAPSLRPQVEALGIPTPPGGLSNLWDALTLPNRQRLVRLLVKEVRVDQRQGKLTLQLNDLVALSQEGVREEEAC